MRLGAPASTAGTGKVSLRAACTLERWGRSRASSARANEPPVFRSRSALSAKVRGDRAQALRGPRVPRPAAGERHGLVAAGVEIRTAQALLGGSNAQLTLGLYAQAVVSLGAAAVDSMAERFGLPARDGRAMERCEEGSEGQDDGET